MGGGMGGGTGCWVDGWTDREWVVGSMRRVEEKRSGGWVKSQGWMSGWRGGRHGGTGRWAW